MTEQEFQKTVLETLQKQGEINNQSSLFQKTVLESIQKQEKNFLGLDKKFSEFQKTALGSIQKQEDFNDKQESFNEKLMDRVITLEVCMEDQFVQQKKFEEKLAVVIENEIVDRLQAENDLFKSYTDRKVKRHEVKFRHEAVA